MDSARQIIRWAVPGWVWLLALCGYAVVDVAFHYPVDRLVQRIKFLVQLPGYGGPLAASIALFVGIGVPLGFMLYQIYFWGYWRGRRHLRNEPRDSGWSIIRDVVERKDISTFAFNKPTLLRRPDGVVLAGDWSHPDETSVGQQGTGKPHQCRSPGSLDHPSAPKVVHSSWRNTHQHISTDHIRNSILKDVVPRRPPKSWWDVIVRTPLETEAIQGNMLIANTLWYHVLEKRSDGDRLEQRSVCLSDIAHCLGASRIAVLTALPAWILLHAAILGPLPKSEDFLPTALVLTMVFFAYKGLTANRRSALRDLRELRRATINSSLLEKS